MHLTVKFEGKEAKLLLVFNTPVVHDVWNEANRPPQNFGIPKSYSATITNSTGAKIESLEESCIVTFTRK